MAISRYEKFLNVRDRKKRKPRLETFPPIKAVDLIDDNNDVIINFQDGQKLDQLAAQYLGDGRYWWAICLLNDIHLPFGSTVLPGTKLRIPTNINNILNHIQTKVDDS